MTTRLLDLGTDGPCNAKNPLRELFFDKTDKTLKEKLPIATKPETQKPWVKITRQDHIDEDFANAQFETLTDEELKKQIGEVYYPACRAMDKLAETVTAIYRQTGKYGPECTDMLNMAQAMRIHKIGFDIQSPRNPL